MRVLSPGIVSLLIRAELALNKQQIYILKPVSTLLVIAIAALAMGEPGSSLAFYYGGQVLIAVAAQPL